MELLDQAESFFRHGDYARCKAMVDQMSDIDRCEPDILDLELRLIPHIDDWGRARQLSDLLEFAVGDQYKITVAEFRVEFAAHLLAEGKVDDARGQLAQACELWLPIKLRILDDDRLEEIF